MLDEERKVKIISTSIVAGIILFFFMLIIMIYQFVLIGKAKNDSRRLEAEIIKLEQQKKELGESIDTWNAEWKIEERAYELGLRYPTDR